MGFFLKRNKEIYFHFYINSKICKYSTKLKINRINWDLSTQRPKLKRGDIGKTSRDITNTLNSYQRQFEILKNEYGASLNKEIVRKQFDKYFHNVKTTIVKKYYNDFFDEFYHELKQTKSIKKVSGSRYYALHKRINAMQIIDKKKYTLLDFDNKFFVRFISYFRNDLKISDNTLNRYLRYLKTFLNWCVKNNYEVNTYYKNVTIKKKLTTHIALTDDDLKVLEEVKLSPLHNYYRDLFLIGCYSGQRFSDYHRFNKKYKKDNFLVIRAKKTGEFSYIPLTNKLTRLLEKYDWVLNKISGQKFNNHIQNICKIAGFTEVYQIDKFYGNNKVSEDVPKWKLIASHTARRTFITLSAQKGVPFTLIMQTTGIKSIKTLEGYIKFDQDKLFESISSAWD